MPKEVEQQSKGGVGTALESEESMVVRLSRLDQMLELAGEVIIVSSNLNAISRQVAQSTGTIEEMGEDIKDLAITSSRISSDLHNLVTDVRTVDMTDLFARFRRLARDTSRRLGKTIRFTVEGQDVCIDKKTSERIYDPIAHQIRNAISHGIEDGPEREKAGKDPVGTVSLVVRNLDNNTIIEINDDGRGIDCDAIRRKALDMGLADSESLAGMGEQELYDFLYMPGFSTTETTSTTSGRGVGMDVVRTVMNELDAEIRVKSQVGAGTTFSFNLPRVTAVNISDALLVCANDYRFAFPISSVIASQAITRDEITTTTGRGRSIIYLGNILPLFDLLEVFGEASVDDDSEQEELRVLIVEHKRKRAAYLVSDFLSPQKIVITDFADSIKVKGLLGTAVITGRQMAMVIDLPGLFEQTFGLEMRCDVSAGGVNAPLADVVSSVVEESEVVEDSALAGSAVESEAVSEDDGASDWGGVTSFDDAGEDLPNKEFLLEVESMLSSLNRQLLDLDEQRTAEMADSVFRMMHSIKGNLTMFGAEESAAITHKIETVLDSGRKDIDALTDDVFDVLFDGSAYLEQVVEALLRDEKPCSAPEKLQEGIERFRPEQRAVVEAEESAGDGQIKLDATGEFFLSSRRRDGAALHECSIEFEPGDQPRFLVGYLILRRIQLVSDVLGASPSMSELEAGFCPGGLKVLFSPRAADDDLIDKLRENLERHFGVSSFDIHAYA